MDTSTFFTTLSQSLGADLGTNLLSKTGNFIGYIAPVFQAALALYVLMVIASYYGQSGMASLNDFVKKIMGWVLIIGLSFAPANYTKLAGIIYQLPDEVAGIFVNGRQFSASVLDESWARVMDLLEQISELNNNYEWYEIAVHLTLTIRVSLVIMICAAVIIGLAFAYYMVAKISLALVLMLGPFFIGCLLFPATRQWGINWIGQCLNYIITTTMFVLLSTVQLAAFDAAVKSALQIDFSIGQAAAVELLPTLFILQTIVFLVAAFNIPNIASTLTGGAAVQGAARQIGQVFRAGTLVGRAAGVVARAASGRSVGGSVSPNRRPY